MARAPIANSMGQKLVAHVLRAAMCKRNQMFYGFVFFWNVTTAEETLMPIAFAKGNAVHTASPRTTFSSRYCSPITTRSLKLSPRCFTVPDERNVRVYFLLTINDRRAFAGPEANKLILIGRFKHFRPMCQQPSFESVSVLCYMRGSGRFHTFNPCHQTFWNLEVMVCALVSGGNQLE